MGRTAKTNLLGRQVKGKPIAGDESLLQISQREIQMIESERGKLTVRGKRMHV